ncbi:MAG: hypothetical protein PHC62_00170 [Candidatus Izemoplasmatales bacterium]|nr:hypothetical protein [Candidatus Izemoplasmatales bacterium]
MYQPIQFFDKEQEKKKFPMREPEVNANIEDKKPEKKVLEEVKTNNSGFKLNLSSMVNGGTAVTANYDKKEPDKKTTKRKTNKVEVKVSDGVTIEEPSDRQLNEFETNTPYEEKYTETNNLLKGTIMQLEMGMGELQDVATEIKKTRDRKKYEYLSDIHGTIGTYLGNKISAIRELNSTISKCNDMEFKRYKELKLTMNDQDDDKAIMDAYQAFVNTPVGSYGFSNLGPSSQDLTLRSNNIRGVDVQGAGGFESYLQNMSPQQHMMALENNPDIEQVIIYDQRTGARYFDVINMKTMEPVPNTDKMDIMLIDEFDLDIKNKVARSINMNITMPLIIIGDATLNEY